MDKKILIIEKDDSVHPHIKEDGKKLILEGVFSEFNTRHHGRIYSAEQYLLHLEEYKNRKQKDENKEIQ